jgi:hypothetical protein
MYTPLRRMTIVTALAIALVTSAMSSSAVARPPDLRTEMQTSGLAGTTAQDFRTPDGASATDAARREQIALAQERYYSSYGEPEPLPAAEPAAPVDDPEPLLPIAVATAALLTIVGASVTLARRRRRVAV